jgi:hypothetical protein
MDNSTSMQPMHGSKTHPEPVSSRADVSELVGRLRQRGHGCQISVPFGGGYCEVTRAGGRYLSMVRIDTMPRGIFAWMEEIAKLELLDLHVIKHRDNCFLCLIDTAPDLDALRNMLERLCLIDENFFNGESTAPSKLTGQP